MLHERTFRNVFAAVVSLLVWGCGGGGNGGQAPGNTLTGSVVLAPVSGATVEALRLHDTGAAAAFVPPRTAVSAADGSFSIDVGAYVGPVLLVATGGNYVDEATGNNDTIAADRPLLGLATAAAGQVTANLTPLTHWGAVAARTLAADPDAPMDLAMANGVLMAQDYFGVTGLLTTLPADLTAGAVAPGNAAEHAAAIAGLSQLASDEGFADPMDLVHLLSLDGSDDRFDGSSRGMGLGFSTDMGGTKLVQALRDFLDTNGRNASGLTSADVATDESIAAHVDTTTSSYAWPPRVGSMDRAGGDAAGGTPVGFFGLRFDSVAGFAVTFDGLPATVTGFGPTFVQVTTPVFAGPGVADVEIRNLDNGLVARLEDCFESFVPGAPSLSSICPTYGPTVGGSLIEVSGDRFDDTSLVFLDGVAAPIVRTAFPHLLVAVAPAHAAGSAPVRVSNGALNSNTAGFEYRDQGVSQNLTDASVSGGWVLYGVVHDHGADAFFAERTELTVDGAGSVAYNRTRRTASPGDLLGTNAVDAGNWPYAVFPDSTLWIDVAPTAPTEEQRRFLRAWIQDEADVFVGGVVERPFETGVYAGVMKGTNMSNADLGGSYWISGYHHQYRGPGDEREITTIIGAAEFDGAGSGSLALLSTSRETGDAAFERVLDFGTFTYTVAADGTFTITDDEGRLIEGSLTQQGDFGAGVTLGTDGVLGVAFLTRRAYGFKPSAITGSWYGGATAQAFEGPPWTEHVYAADRVRILADAQGVGLLETLVKDTSDTDTEGTAEEAFKALQLVVSPSGQLVDSASGWPELTGAVGGSGRFALFLPSYPFGDGGQQDEQPCGVLLRNCSHYSQWSLDQVYNSATLSHSYEAPQMPPLPTEELLNYRGQMTFDPATPVTIQGLPFAASGTVISPGGPVKKLRREANGGADTAQDTDPGFDGGYAVAGDGRVYVFEVQAAILGLRQLAQEEDLVVAVGQTTPHGQAAMLRGPVLEGSESTFTALTRQTGNLPPVFGDYVMCELSLGFDLSQVPVMGYGRVARGTIRLDDPAPGSFTGSLDFLERTEDGTETPSSDPAASGTYVLFVDGTLTVTPAGGTPLGGIATPDGAAVILVDDSPNSTNVGFTFLVRKKTTPGAVNVPACLSMLGLEHLYTVPSPPPAEAGIGLFEGSIRAGTAADVALTGATRKNTKTMPEVSGYLELGMVLAVGADGSLTVTGLTDALRGGLSDNGRYACLILGDPTPTDIQNMLMLGR